MQGRLHCFTSGLAQCGEPKPRDKRALHTALCACDANAVARNAHRTQPDRRVFQRVPELGSIRESVLRLLSIILADAGDRPVTLCGELAGLRRRVAEPGACARAADRLLALLDGKAGALSAA